MNILALEFSSPQRSVAVLSETRAGVSPGSTGPSSAVLPPPASAEAVEIGSRTMAPLAMIETVLREAQLEREQVECLAVGLGPGSYTGIRAAIALAQGWQLARPVKLLGVSSANSIAAQALDDRLTGPVTVVIDAQRNEVYLAGYELSPAGWRQVQPLRLTTLTEARVCEQEGQLLVGPEVTNWFSAGRIVFPRAAALARMVSGRSDFLTGDKLEPIYLRETRFVKAPPPRLFPS
jgi:tRNA threonylcarbamoyl adenosine modification protein YeaZ